MKQSAKVILIAVIATGVLAFVLRFLSAAVGADRPGMGLILTGLAFSLVMVGLVIYTNLQKTRAVPLADDGAREQALSAPGAGSARLLVVREGFVGKLQGLDIAVDGVVRAQLKSPRFAAIDLAPGQHEVEVRAQGMAPARIALTLAGREIAAVRVAMRVGAVSVVSEPLDAALRQRLAAIPMVAA